MTKEQYRVLAINPGSTSTKASIFENDAEVWKTNVVHAPEELAGFETIGDQGPFRRDTILAAIDEAGLNAQNFDAVVGVGGVGLAGVPYGTYGVNETMLDDATSGKYASHPNNLGVIIAHEIAATCGAQAMAAGMASSEEFQEVAHVGGFAQTPRRCCVHMLNTKEVALRHAAAQGKSYKDLNLVIAHVGGGITVAAHRKGMVVDGTDGVDQEGPMTPNRPGTVRLVSFMKLIAGLTPAEQKKLVSTQGGFMSHLGTSDALEVKRMIAEGDEYARLVYDALLYQVAGWIGHMAAVLKGEVDGVILTGGLMNDEYAAAYITEMVSWIAPVSVYPGELEGEALAAAALRVLRGEEELLEYTGVPVWSGFDHLKRA
ncbi:butyrate kinase [Eggerthellaceae bacterium zg-887]|uniref:butyrate kinase n=1 Tax=Xiamenia xianingshaonis TaxID=2682776 RepID=UPI0014082ACC|nr:butyrate kinase [Xiamenia xianingshaonis]NHM15687.1 butyrate kinase [Xiamenia xianingshaonis]